MTTIASAFAELDRTVLACQQKQDRIVALLGAVSRLESERDTWRARSGQ